VTQTAATHDRIEAYRRWPGPVARHIIEPMTVNRPL